jgi:exodeoxyribonuclease-3
VDIGRQLIAAPERYYSWWSYRAKDWRVNDKGRRLDHIWGSPAVAARARIVCWRTPAIGKNAPTTCR